MKKIIIVFVFLSLFTACASASFKNFYNNHKNEIGATSIQVPNFLKAVLSNLSSDVKSKIGNITDFKYIKFNKLKTEKRQNLIKEMNAVTGKGYTDVFRMNEIEKTRIISVREAGNIVTDAIIFTSTENETTAYYLQGNLDPEKIKSFSNEETFNSFSKSLINSYQYQINPSIIPNNQ